ncbi:MAG TPA: aspartate dehydrogenase domain-containing protein, partial [Burkholderiaceae bacterium]|nr:aspartate dehydrogenase domain-containing protein [Burkholderiaceae bacterium]
KPPAAWRGTVASGQIDLDRVGSATTVFEGTARAAVTLYPQNANVAATLALAGIGFDRTEVTLIADPSIKRNIHSFEAESATGRLRFESEGYATASNAKTSVNTALSAVSYLRTGVGFVPI